MLNDLTAAAVHTLLLNSHTPFRFLAFLLFNSFLKTLFSYVSWSGCTIYH